MKCYLAFCRFCPPWILAAVLLSILPGILLAAKRSEEWKTLKLSADFNEWRDDHDGWEIVGSVKLDKENPRRFIQRSGDGILVSNGDGVNLETRDEFQDVHLKLEFLIPTSSNSGVKLMGRYEIQIRDTYGEKNLSGDACGGIYPRAEQEPRYHHIDRGYPPRVNAAKKPGEWQTLEVEFVAPRFDESGKKLSDARFRRVLLNGKLVHENVSISAPTGAAWRLVKEVPQGPILLQGDHGRVAFRNIQVRPLRK